MKESFRETLKNTRESLKRQETFTNIMLANLDKIDIPDGMDEPSIGMGTPSNTNFFIWLRSWPLEASCGIATELESILDTEFIFSFDENSARYTFFTGTPYEFCIINYTPRGCKIVTEGEYQWPKATKIECGEERPSETDIPF
jgi:hypothetical protein